MNIDSSMNNMQNSQGSLLPPNAIQATEFVIKRARELVNQLSIFRRQEAPPFLARDLASHVGVKDVICADIGEIDGILMRCEDGYVIKVNVNHHEVRRNFSCAHEIGHIFLDELDKQFSPKNTEWRGGTGIQGDEKERLCNVAAAELLMPMPIFSKYLADFGLSIDSIERLAHIFKVSIPAAAIRVQEISPERCRIIRWNRWQRSRSQGFIQRKTKEPAKQTYVRDPSPLLKAYKSNKTFESFRYLEIDKTRKRCCMESKGFGQDNTRWVLSLVFLDQ